MVGVLSHGQYGVIALLLAASALSACDRSEKAPAPQTAPVAQPPPAPAPVPLPTPAALSRENLLEALSAAASAYAAGEATAGVEMVGRTFRVVLPFGCAGPAATGPDGLAAWSRSADGAAIRLSVRPADWSQSPLVAMEGETPTWDAVNGFWIARPWLRKPGCPAAPAAPAAGATAEAPAPMTAGLAWILPKEGSRLGQKRGEAYAFTLREGVKDSPAAGEGGFRLVLEGRIGEFADGVPIRCTATSADRAPVCVAAVQVDVLAFEDLNGARLREWRPT